MVGHICPLTQNQMWFDCDMCPRILRTMFGTGNLMSPRGSLFFCAPVYLRSYDFWAVGINCCNQGRDGLFRCGEYANIHARSGLRYMDQAHQSEDC